jgi:glycosyltransferase involved in cell wall biosynthesis
MAKHTKVAALKIALYVHCFFPDHYHGTETYTLALAKNLQAMGHEPVVVSAIFQGEKKSVSPITRYEYQGIPVYCIDKNQIPRSGLSEIFYQPSMIQVHKNLLRELRPDIVHVTHLINHTASLLDAAHELSIPLVATFTDFFGFCMNLILERADGGLCVGPNAQRTNCFACCVKESIKRTTTVFSEQALNRGAPIINSACTLFNSVYRLPIFRRSKLSSLFSDIKALPELLAKRYAYYRAVIAPTQFLQSAYERNGLTAAPIHKINFGVDLNREPKHIRPPSAPTRFGFIGQIAPHKGTDLLVEAFCRLPQGKSELYIYGSEQQSPAYAQAMRNRSTNFPVFFRGTFPEEQMRSVLDELDFLVIPSTWYENSPLVLLDALASHTPVIVSDVEGLTEFLEPGKNGYAFKRGSVDDLERVLLEITQQPGLLCRMSEHTEYNHTTREMTEEVVSIYKSIIRSDVQ